jgi:uncharacterized MAPEG superfamily protein
MEYKLVLRNLPNRGLRNDRVCRSHASWFNRRGRTLELKALVWSAVLRFVQMLVAVAGAQLQVGLSALAGNRENLPVFTCWAGRARRAYLNMLENLVLFAILALVAQVAGKADSMTVLCCQIFFLARIVPQLFMWPVSRGREPWPGSCP